MIPAPERSLRWWERLFPENTRFGAWLQKVRWCKQAQWGDCACRGDGGWNGSVLEKASNIYIYCPEGTSCMHWGVPHIHFDWDNVE